MISTGLKLSSNLNEGAMYFILYWQFNRLITTKIINMNIQDELIKIHSKFGTSEKANYEIEKLFNDNINNKSISIIECEFEENDCSTYISFKDVGIVKVSYYKDSPNYLYISSLFVKSEYRSEYIGTRLIKECENYAIKKGIKFINLKVITNSWIHKWYNRLKYIDYFIDGKYIELIKVL